VANCRLVRFLSQILPRKIRVHKAHEDSAQAAGRAIVDEFHGPHGTTREEIELAGFKWDEFADFSMKSYPTRRASNLSDALWTDPPLVQNP
jgi:hypothetical protein